MGNCCGLFGNDDNGYQEHRSDHQSPNRVSLIWLLWDEFIEILYLYSFEAELRELQAQAAEKRLRENSQKGIKDIDAVKRQQARRDQRDNLEATNRTQAQSEGLKWSVN